MILKTFSNSFRNTTLNAQSMEYFDGTTYSAISTYCNAIWRTTSAVNYSDNSLGWYLRLGSSNEASLYNSGNMISPIDNLTVVSKTVVYDLNDLLRGVVFHVRNDTAGNITIREIGLGAKYGPNAVIFARRVLDTPITIAPEETYGFTYSIRIRT